MKPAEVQDLATKLNISTEELFRRAYVLYGLHYGTMGPMADHAWMVKNHTVAPYVSSYAKRWDRLRHMMRS